MASTASETSQLVHVAMASSTAPINDEYRKAESLCVSILDKDFSDRTEGGQMETEIARFRLWAANISAHRRSVSSLDYRLREAKGTRGTVLELLRSISETLQHRKFSSMMREDNFHS